MGRLPVSKWKVQLANTNRSERGIAANPLPPQRIATQPVVIGVMVLDINATPNSAADSNRYTRLSSFPGKVAYISGGVARNVADCMSKLKLKPLVITAVGHDLAGNFLWEEWNATGLSVDAILRHQDIDTAVSCNTFDGKGELAAAVASVESIEPFLTPDWIGRFKQEISSAPILMVDANLSYHSLEASCQIADHSGTPVWFDPASVAKSGRITSAVEYVRFVSANEDELIAMANVLYGSDIFSPVRRDHSTTVESLFELLKPAIRVLLQKKVKVIVVNVGSDGVFLCSKAKSDLGGLDFRGNQPPPCSKQLSEAVDAKWSIGASKYNLFSDFFAVHFPALSATVVRDTGAGDCLVGATIASLCAGLDVMRSVAVGIAAAKFAVEVETNVPPELSLNRIVYDAKTSVYSRMSVSQRNSTKNSSYLSKDLATSQPPPQNKNINNPLLWQSQSQNSTIGDHASVIRGTANNYQISRGHARQIDEQMIVRGQEYEQPIRSILNQHPQPSVQAAPQKKDAVEKPKYAEILKVNLPPEAIQKDKFEEESQVEEEQEEEDAQMQWETVQSRKANKRSAKVAREAYQRAAATGRNKHKFTKY
ncbi:pseudouridine kinase-like [Lycium barbarum]|uniref:pseudouridine kinase-like n=1 Tax=Lycium barbarum TaxID=112863 RepID=UPI00293F5936|nr:pseudouridine kinase-like [Lycium barbarum]